MDLATGAKQVFVMMTLLTKDGTPKLVPQCTYPLTGAGCVNRVYTDVATFDITTEGVKVTATYGVTFDELAGMLDIALIVGTATYDLLPRVARAVGAHLPSIELEVYGEQLGPDIADALVAGRLDIGVTRDPVGDLVDAPAVSLHPLRQESLIAAIPSDHALADEGEVALVPETVTSLSVQGVEYRSLSDINYRTNLVMAYRAGEGTTAVEQVANVMKQEVAAELTS